MRLSCKFVNVDTIAYRVYVYTRASLIHSPNPNPDSSNQISPKGSGRIEAQSLEVVTVRSFTPSPRQQVFSARCNIIHLALMLRCQCPSLCPSVCDGSALTRYS